MRIADCGLAQARPDREGGASTARPRRLRRNRYALLTVGPPPACSTRTRNSKRSLQSQSAIRNPQSPRGLARPLRLLRRGAGRAAAGKQGRRRSPHRLQNPSRLRALRRPTGFTGGAWKKPRRWRRAASSSPRDANARALLGVVLDRRGRAPRPRPPTAGAQTRSSVHGRALESRRPARALGRAEEA